VTVFFRVARPLAWPDARENGMTVTTAREVSEDEPVGLDEVPPAGLRLRLQPDRSGRGPLDGGWWPRTDLVKIPLRAGEQDAAASMEQAAKAGNLQRAPAILAAVGPGSS
jgi:hypothetical protein